jgi:hypothetical protein
MSSISLPHLAVAAKGLGGCFAGMALLGVMVSGQEQAGEP